MSKKLSIIIPYHSNIKFLERLLSSIPMNQTMEIIIVNDNGDFDLCSSEVLTNRKDVHCVNQLEKKRWAGAARNLGLKLAKGDFVIFADSDDFFLEGFFDIVAYFFDKKFDAIFFSPTSMLEGGGRSDRHLLYSMLVDDYLENGAEDILYKFHAPWSKLYRREYLIRENIIFDEVIASNDVNFSLKASYFAKKNYFVDRQSIYCVVESPSSLTKTKSMVIAESRFDVLCRYNDFLISKNDSNLAPMIGRLLAVSKFKPRLITKKVAFCWSRGYKLMYSKKNIIRAFKLFRLKSSSADS